MTDLIDMTPDFGINENTSIIKVLGVGGGGSNAVQHMYLEGIKGVDYLICNTDQGHLDRNRVPKKLLLGNGLGAGAKPEVAAQFANESRKAIADFIGKETQMLFITAGMGKGTGTGASPIIAEVAKEMGILTIGVVTYPFDYEGSRRQKQAQKGIDEMAKNVDSLIIIKNENILKYYQDEEIMNSYGYADDVLKNACKCIAEMITCDYYQNVDFNDVKTIMKDSGKAMLGIATASGEDRVQRVVDEALSCPLLDSSVIKNAENFLFFISFGPNAHFSGSELKEITSRLQEMQSDDAEIIHGMGVDETLDDAIKLSVIITKFDTASAYIENQPAFIQTETKNEPEIFTTPQPIGTDVINGTVETPMPQPEPIPEPIPEPVDTDFNMPQEPINTPSFGPQRIYEGTPIDLSNDSVWADTVGSPAISRRQETLMNSFDLTSENPVMQDQMVEQAQPKFENLRGDDLNEFFADIPD
ncbi:MAG: cell division protein FtsZ [Bacteroidales bacterium]|nr:cell division protein FtsZ [Bacteroidales bacterium]